MKKYYNLKIAYSALFLAIALVLPFFTGQIREIGNMLLPMHIPVLLCGFICGWQCGLAVGFCAPLLRSVLFGMPLLYPNAISMAFELAAYGLICALIYGSFKRKNIITAYISLIVAMLGGRIVWGIVQTVILGLSGKSFFFTMFISSAFVNAVPGIILQLAVIPALVLIISKLVLKEENNE